MTLPGNALFWMFVGHALADYPLQGDWLSKAKNPTLEPVPGERIWSGAMACHCMIHSAAVLLATGSTNLAFAEYVAHFVIDYLKCKGKIYYGTDQLLHNLCKVAWFIAMPFVA